MDDNYTYDVFISYAHEDFEWCKMLAERLRQAGVRVWFDRWELRPGHHLLVKINEGLQGSRRMVSVWTSNYFRDSKVWTILESFSRQHDDVLSVDRPIIPVQREQCSIPPTLKNIISIDFTNDTAFEDSFRILIDSLDISTVNTSSDPDHSFSDENQTDIDADIPCVNPYSIYSRGGVVIDPAMFFGREELLTKILVQLNQSTSSQCFVLYGQKRIGKSSLLYHLKYRISQPYLPVYTNLCLLISGNSETPNSFIEILLNDLKRTLSEHTSTDLLRWPSDSLIVENPIDAFREGLWAAEEVLLRAGWNEPRVIFLIDEFSYLYLCIKAGSMPHSIMRQWKTLIQLGQFSAVLAGGEIMAKFIATFPNEFGTSRLTAHVGHLAHTDVRNLADMPILLHGKTRYRGNTLDRLEALSGGHPYFIQIICSRLVDHLNERKRLLITDSDLDKVVKDLIFGVNRLRLDHFEPLVPITSKTEGQFSYEFYLDILSAIAHASLHNDVGPEDLTHFEDISQALEELIHSHTLFIDPHGSLHIRVGLFAEWLRLNRH